MSETPSPNTLECAVPETEKTWRVGTLSYNRAGLYNVFFWMLWGDFCLFLMDNGVAATLIPLQLKRFGASNATIGLLTGSVVEFMSVLLVAFVSTWSDRHRGKLGRRIPFMLYSAPFIAIFLAVLGFSPQIAHGLQAAFPKLFAGMELATLTVGVITVAMVGQAFFDTFPQTAYFYMWADVIPPKLMGTFACLFRVASTGGVFAFNLFMLPHAENHPAPICLITAALYLIAFTGLAWQVKEGKYPPPPPRVKWTWPGEAEIARYSGASGSMRDTITRMLARILPGPIFRFVMDCYSLSFYWKFYLYNICFFVGYRSFAKFLIFYGRDYLHIDLGHYGKIMATRDLVQIGIFFALGPIVDKLHPMRAGLIGFVLLMLTSLAAFAFIRGPWSFAAFTILFFSTFAIYQGATGALGPRLLPREQYGQFCAANAILWHLACAAGIYACGKFLDVAGYRYLFAWPTVWCALGIGLMYLVYIDWKKLGGAEGYVAPLAAPQVAAEEVGLAADSV
jgi:maltose/moltooligosaccharide transporter